MKRKFYPLVASVFGGLAILAFACKPTPSANKTAKPVGYALWFDGQNDFLRTDKWLSGAGKGFCIEAWVKPAPSNPSSSLGSFLVHRATGRDKRLRYDVEKNAFSFAAFEPPNLDMWVTSGRRRVTTGGWHHVATVGDGRAMILYVDGEAVAQTSTTAALDWDTAWQGSFIGADPLPGALVQGNFRGLIDEVRVWNVPRTANDIRATMKGPVAPATLGLAAYWNFDEGNGRVARDITGRGHDAHFGSTPDPGPDDPKWIRSDCPIGDLAKAGPAGHDLWFSGQNTRVLTGPLDGLRSAKAFTIEAWIRPSAPITECCLFASSGTLAKSDFSFWFDGKGSLNGGMQMASGATLSSGADDCVRAGVWQHIAFVYGDRGSRFLVNGRCVKDYKEARGHTPQFRGDPIILGGAESSFFSGEMDELRLWSVARTEAQIKETKNRTIAPSEPGLVGYWRFDEGDGKVARDLSPSAAHAQLGDSAMPDKNDPLWLVSDAPIAASAAAETTRPARQNFALQFDGKNTYVDMGNAPELRMPGPLTVEAWVKPATVAETELPILAKENANGQQNAYELLLTKGVVAFQVSDGSAGCCGAQGWFPAMGKTALQPGLWRHVAGVYDGRQISVYLDGVLEGSMAFDRTIPDVPFSVKVGMNAFSAPKYFAGLIDEVKLWNRARSQSEILTDMNRSLRGNEPGLVGYWTFDEPDQSGGTTSTCQIAFDHSGHQNHGFLGGAMAREANDPRWVVSDAPVAPSP